MGVKDIEEQIEFNKSEPYPHNNPVINKSYQNKIDTLKTVLDFFLHNGQDYNKVRDLAYGKLALIKEIREDKDWEWSESMDGVKIHEIISRGTL